LQDILQAEVAGEYIEKKPVDNIDRDASRQRNLVLGHVSTVFYLNSYTETNRSQSPPFSSLPPHSSSPSYFPHTSALFSPAPEHELEPAPLQQQ
jgi:hypothetical protein